MGGHSLTGGQKQRLAIARAIYDDPVYIVMDEPNASLDEDGENKLCELIVQLKEQGALVIFSTHRPRLVAVADLALVLHDGGQVAFGPVKDVISSSKRRISAPTATAVAAPQPSPSTPEA
jgi:ABC-type protease/lipase transport system fused ATPase/permease subunit